MRPQDLKSAIGILFVGSDAPRTPLGLHDRDLLDVGRCCCDLMLLLAVEKSWTILLLL